MNRDSYGSYHLGLSKDFRSFVPGMEVRPNIFLVINHIVTVSQWQCVLDSGRCSRFVSSQRELEDQTHLGDDMYFVPSSSAKGCKKSLEIRCKSLEIGSVQLCGTQGLPSVFEPYVIHPGPCQPDQHAYWCQVWKRQTPLLTARGQPGVSALCWVQNREGVGSGHENQG